LFGRVGSLLEVGTGFHPELTGRENVYLNGAILGMRKAEIDSKFDEIVTFAEIEKFLDTAVKRYSSGMYVRLAFGVAAHLNPEILVIDEVLAVGDSAFQKKCLGKMKDVTKDGRTVIFVSHNVGAVQQLCTRAILLNEGQIVMDGSPQSVVSRYLSTGMEQMGERIWKDLENAPGDDCARLRGVRVTDAQGNVCTMFDVRDPITIEIDYTVFQDRDWLEVSLYLYNDRGDIIFVSIDDVGRSELSEKRPAGNYKSACHIPPDFLNNGQMFVLAALTDEKTVHTIERDVVSFTVNDAMNPTGARARSRAEWPFSAVRPKLEWRVDWTPDARP
jgi:lipopolysaccharide transport system ATP-binding protein